MKEVKCVKIFFGYLLIILILLSSNGLIEGGGDALFLKTGISPIKDNKKAPNFCLENLSGKKVELKQFKGKVIFLNFWATWCGPCKEEMPSMEALYQKFKEKGFVFLTISVDYAGLKPVKEFIEKNRYTFPVLLDPKYEALDLYEVKGIPTTILIDKKGILIGKAIGPRNWRSQEVISLLNLLIEK
ncbi:MAG: TlpA disulfide reductase family protein [Thermodesulfobacteriota bacterium]